MDSAVREGGLPELLEALRWRWKSALLVTAAVVAGATLYVESLPPAYDASAVIAVQPRPDVETAGADTVRVIGPKYVAYLEAASTARLVADEFDVSAEELEDAVDATLVPDTGNVSIVARMGDPQLAAEVANAFARQAVEFARDDPLLLAQTIAPALPPDEPAAPPRRLFEAASLLAGLLLGIGVALLIERGRPRVRSWRDMAKLTGYPVLGRLPNARALRRPTEAFSDPVVGSSFRTLRANLEPQLRDQDVDLVLVTSPSKGDGKTTVAALVAEAMARLGTRTLLIDADLKRPRLARMAQMDGSGLDDVLKERVSFREAVRPAWTEGLYVLPTQHSPDAGDLLARRFADVVREAREEFDLILVDAPPLLGTDDARTLAPVAEGVLLVVSAGSMETQVNEAILAVESLRAPLLGLVGNRLKESRSHYYY